MQWDSDHTHFPFFPGPPSHPCSLSPPSPQTEHQVQFVLPVDLLEPGPTPSGQPLQEYWVLWSVALHSWWKVNHLLVSWFSSGVQPCSVHRWARVPWSPVWLWSQRKMTEGWWAQSRIDFSYSPTQGGLDSELSLTLRSSAFSYLTVVASFF